MRAGACFSLLASRCQALVSAVHPGQRRQRRERPGGGFPSAAVPASSETRLAQRALGSVASCGNWALAFTTFLPHPARPWAACQALATLGKSSEKVGCRCPGRQERGPLAPEARGAQRLARGLAGSRRWPKPPSGKTGWDLRPASRVPESLRQQGPDDQPPVESGGTIAASGLPCKCCGLKVSCRQWDQNVEGQRGERVLLGERVSSAFCWQNVAVTPARASNPDVLPVWRGVANACHLSPNVFEDS